MPNIGPTEILILLVVLVVLFGASRLPKAAEGIGKSLKVFKREVNSAKEEDAAAQAKSEAPPQAIHPETTQTNGTTHETAPPVTHQEKK